MILTKCGSHISNLSDDNCFLTLFGEISLKQDPLSIGFVLILTMILFFCKLFFIKFCLLIFINYNKNKNKLYYKKN